MTQLDQAKAAALAEIEAKAKTLADARALLAERMEALQTEISAAKRRKLPGIKSALGEAANAENDLRALIEHNPGLFVKPRTVVFHGVKLGFQKGKGKMDWADDAQVITLIRKHLADQAEVLIQVTEKPVKEALKNLAAPDLARIGVTVEESGDHVLVKAADSELDKLVDALLKAATGDEQLDEPAK
jgi:predicted ATPase